MSKKLPIFYSAMLLTGVNLLLRFAGTAFQVYLSARIGAEGIGLLQLVLTVGTTAMVAGMAGIRTATMYLTAEELGKQRPQNTRWVLSGCLLYSCLFSGVVAIILYLASPFLAANWIREPATADALRVYCLFLPVNCLTGVMVGYFTGANRIGTLAAVEVAEQCASIVLTLCLLRFWSGKDAVRCTQAVILGSGLSACLTLACLCLLRIAQRIPNGASIPIARRLADAALPLALADNLKTGLNMVENLMVPRRLARYGGPLSPLAAFGIVTGMVFPVLMFPACILFGLVELLIPEFARCAAAGSRQRIRYLVQRSLKITAVYSLCIGGAMFLLAKPLCQKLYGSEDAGAQLQLYALLIPMLYCDAIVDAAVKGLGQQKICVRYNILTSALDVTLLYLLLPRWGMRGYFVSFFITHLLNFLLSLGRLIRISGVHFQLRIPFLSGAAGILSLWCCRHFPSSVRPAVYLFLLPGLLVLSGILRKTDLLWLKNMALSKKVPSLKHGKSQTSSCAR